MVEIEPRTSPIKHLGKKLINHKLEHPEDQQRERKLQLELETQHKIRVKKLFL